MRWTNFVDYLSYTPRRSNKENDDDEGTIKQIYFLLLLTLSLNYSLYSHLPLFDFIIVEMVKTGEVWKNDKQFVIRQKKTILYHR